MSDVVSILETFDPVFRKISEREKKKKKNEKQNRRDNREQRIRNDQLQNAQGRSLLGGGGAFTGRPGSITTLG